MPRTGPIKNGPNFEGDKAKIIIAVEIWDIFNETSFGIYKLAIEKIMIFLESIKNFHLYSLICHFHVNFMFSC